MLHDATLGLLEAKASNPLRQSHQCGQKCGLRQGHWGDGDGEGQTWFTRRRVRGLRYFEPGAVAHHPDTFELFPTIDTSAAEAFYPPVRRPRSYPQVSAGRAGVCSSQFIMLRL